MVLSEARRRRSALKESESRENEARYLRRTRMLETEYDLSREARRNRLETARANHRPESIMRAFEGQIAKLDADYQRALTDLEQTRDVHVELSPPLAACFVEIRRIG